LATPVARDRREHDSVNNSTSAPPLPPSAAADRQLLSSTSAAMFSSNLTTTPGQYEQFIRLQQLLMHMQTGGLLQLPDNGAQVRNIEWARPRKPQPLISLLWRHRVTWRHQWRHQSILHAHFSRLPIVTDLLSPVVSAISLKHARRTVVQRLLRYTVGLGNSTAIQCSA